MYIQETVKVIIIFFNFSWGGFLRSTLCSRWQWMLRKCLVFLMWKKFSIFSFYWSTSFFFFFPRPLWIRNSVGCWRISELCSDGAIIITFRVPVPWWKMVIFGWKSVELHTTLDLVGGRVSYCVWRHCFVTQFCSIDLKLISLLDSGKFGKI